MSDMSRTRDALAAFDAASAAYDVASVGEMSAAEAIEGLEEIDRLAAAVGNAFGLDTADRNNLDTCRQCVRPGPFVRRIVEEWEATL